MINQILLFAILTVSKIALSFPIQEKINPVDLKYYCIEVTAAGEKVHNQIPVLLVHGLGGTHKNWDGINLHLSLRTKRKVCSVDLRNHGDSPWNKRTDVKALVVDIGHFLDKQGIKKVNIIGHSLGGKVAVHYAINNPNRVNSLVVEDMRPNGVVKKAWDNIVTFFKLLNEAVVKVPLRVTEENAREIIIKYLNTKSDEFGGAVKFTKESITFLELKQVDGKWNFKLNMDVILKALNDQDTFLGRSSGIYKRPALFIYGVESPMKVGEDKSNILKMFPKAKIVPVKGAGHIIHREHREFEEEVIKFLTEVN